MIESDFYVAALDDSLARFGVPDIFNTDQGCQFTSRVFVSLLQENGIRISMDGRGCWRDNIMVERLWRSLKYENIYLHAYEAGSEARRGISDWINDYNKNRGHSSLADYTPDEVYYGVPTIQGPDPRVGEIKAA